MLSFFKFRDTHGTIQLVAAQNEVLDILRKIAPNSTVLVQGTVRLRPEQQRRPVMALQHLIITSADRLLQVPGGSVEVLVNSVTLLNSADRSLPFDPFDEHNLVRRLC